MELFGVGNYMTKVPYVHYELTESLIDITLLHDHQIELNFSTSS